MKHIHALPARIEERCGRRVESCLMACRVALDFGADQVRLGFAYGVAQAIFATEKEIYTVLRLLPEIVDSPQRERCSFDLETILVRFITLRLQNPQGYPKA
jgi:hypothetical protein